MLPDNAVYDLREHAGHDTVLRDGGVYCHDCGRYVREEAAAALDRL